MGVHTRYNDQVRASAELKTKGRLAPELIQSLQVLVMQASEIEAFATDAAERNPLLELNYDNELFSFEPMPAVDSMDASGSAPADESGEAAARAFKGAPGLRMESGSVEWDFSRIQDQCMQTESLQSFLHIQASALNLSPEDSAIMEGLIEGVSEDGYYEGSAGQLAFELGAEISRVEELLATLQGFQPAGVGARSLEDCLVRQVSPAEPHRELVIDVIQNHLGDLADGHQGLLARELRVSNEVMAAVIAAVKSLNPRPGAEFYQRPDYSYVFPDISVRCEHGCLEASVLGSQQPCLVLNVDYAGMLEDRSLPSDARSFLESCSAEASAVIRNLESRNSMLERFAAVLLRRQARFFLTEGRFLAPMTMQEVADELGVHVSVVSRAVHGKYLQVPWGCIPLKSMFTRALPKKGADGRSQEVSSAEVKERIVSNF
ncbi:MAG: hypothetical protein ACI36V_01445, partial [Coriobacteriales bacterium]